VARFHQHPPLFNPSVQSCWWEIRDAITSPLTEETILAILKFNGNFNLVEGGSVTSTQSPESMAKFLLIQCLDKRSLVDRYRKEIGEVVELDSCSSILEGYIRKLLTK
jgi:hypothetical protein